jgi:hypothetical protein
MERHMPVSVIAVGEGRVGPDECDCGHDQQHDAADGLDARQALARRKGTLGYNLGSGHIVG